MKTRVLGIWHHGSATAACVSEHFPAIACDPDPQAIAGLVAGVAAIGGSNQAYKDWPRRNLRRILGELSNRKIAVLGPTYKPGTDPLRRSSAIELCRWLASQGGVVEANDPAIQRLPPDAAVRESSGVVYAAVGFRQGPK
jgi:UDP-glucose 6-dehydrogenase